MIALRGAPKPRGEFPDYNFMTPEIIGYYAIYRGVVELSRGTGIMPGTVLFGVTLSSDASGPYGNSGESQVFHSEQAAREYIRSLGG
jgi:hypothetical protein